jgi:membrane protease YdiL (CAAX protease family)
MRINQQNNTQSFKRIYAVAEVVGVLGSVMLSGWGLRALKDIVSLRAFQIQVFGQPIVVKAVFFIILPMIIVKLKGEKPGEYGIAFDNLSYHLKIGLKSLAIVIMADLAFPLVNALGMSYTDWVGALILSFSYVVALVLVILVLRKEPTYQEQAGSGQRILIFFLIFIGLTILSAVTIPLGKQVGGFTFGLFTIGFGEEILFRGYIQSRLNRAFGKPFHTWGVRWGLGLIITAILFGSMHFFHGTGTLWWGLWTIFPGLVFGFLREKTGGIVAPAIAHGVPAAIVYVFMGGIN